jgi:hypothetical protein
MQSLKHEEKFWQIHAASGISMEIHDEKDMVGVDGSSFDCDDGGANGDACDGRWAGPGSHGHA